MKHPEDMTQQELLALPVFNDESGAIQVDRYASVLMPPPSVTDNFINGVEDDNGTKWRVSLIADQWMRFRSIGPDDAAD